MRLWPGGFGTRLMRAYESPDSGAVVEWWTMPPLVIGGTREERKQYEEVRWRGLTCVIRRSGEAGHACLTGRLTGAAAAAMIQRLDSLRAQVRERSDPRPGFIQVDGRSLRLEELRGPHHSMRRFQQWYLEADPAAAALLRQVDGPAANGPVPDAR
jgi:hypothetical protein